MRLDAVEFANSPAVDEDLIRRLPLPLAQLYRRAHNAKTTLDRHQNAYFLWEASLKLLGSVVIIEYAELNDNDPEMIDRLRNLARPSTGHWWEFVRRLVPILADPLGGLTRRPPPKADDSPAEVTPPPSEPTTASAAEASGDIERFVTLRDFLTQTRYDMPRAAGLFVSLENARGRKVASQTTVQLSELFDRLVEYRNREIGHGALGQRGNEHYQSLSSALLLGVAEILGHLDLLIGSRLIYVADVRRQATGRWLVERYELLGEWPRRLESLDLPAHTETANLPRPGRVYIEQAAATGSAGLGSLRSLHPLMIHVPDSEARDTADVYFLNAHRGRGSADYLCYSSGHVLRRDDLHADQRELLAHVLRAPVDAEALNEWQEQSETEDVVEIIEKVPRRIRTIGEFELISRVGRGGMGVVYRAWQPSLGRQVALKCLLRSGEPVAEARFAREIRALGRVEHPNLVKIFTCGSEGEQWFYAMEFVEGADLSAICQALTGTSAAEIGDVEWQQAFSTACEHTRTKEETISESRDGAKTRSADQTAPGKGTEDSPGGWTSFGGPRLSRGHVAAVVEIMRLVAEATHVLNEAGVVHRDIKPANIILTPHGAHPVLMDLGLAQMADEEGGRLTRTRQFVGTLRYASPEQVLAVAKIDQRSDVYSLGATLWELLTLQPLFGATDEMSSVELIRRIQLVDPEGPRKHCPRVSRDLEAVVLKCLEKDPGCRYSTAQDLVNDLKRYEAGEPVQARPVGGVQRGWRWCRRRPAIASMLATLATVVIASIIGLSALYVRAEHQRKIAERREAGSRELNEFYENNVLAAVRPKSWNGGGGKDITLKQALDAASPTIEKAFDGQPELEATVRHTLGMTYYYLAEYKNDLLERSYEIRRKELGPDHPETLTSQHDLAMQRWKQNRLGEAIDLERDALERRRRVLGPEHEDALFSQLNLGLFLSEDGRDEEAEPLLQDGVERCRRVLGPDHHHTLYGQNDLAVVLGNKGKTQESYDLDRLTLEGRLRSLGPDDPDTLRSMANVACSLWSLDKLDEAEELCRKALDGRRRVLGEAHTETYWSINNLAGILSDHGKLNEAEEVRRKQLETSRRIRGADDPDTLTVETDLATFLREQGKLAEATQLLQEVVDSSRSVLKPENFLTLERQYQLAWTLDDDGKQREAEALYRQTLEVQTRVRGPDHPETLRTKDGLAVLLHAQGKYSEAEKLFRDLYEASLRAHKADHPDTVFYRSNLATALKHQGKLLAAELLYKAVTDTRMRLHGAEDSNTLEAESNLAILLESECQLEEAEKRARNNWEVSERKFGSDSPITLGYQYTLAQIWFDRGKFEESEKLLRQELEIEKRINGPQNASTLVTQSYLADLVQTLGRIDEAEKLSREVLEASRDAAGAENPNTLGYEIDRATVLEDEGKYDEAEKLIRHALAVNQRTKGPDNTAALANQSWLARDYQLQGRYHEAEALLRETLETCRRTLGAENLNTLSYQTSLATDLQEEGNLPEAEKLLREVLSTEEHLLVEGADKATGVESSPPVSEAILASRGSLADVLVDAGKLDEAQTLYRSVLESQRQNHSPESLALASTLLDYSRALIRDGNTTEAEPLIKECLKIREKDLPPTCWKVAEARSVLGTCRVGQKKFAEAEELLLAAQQALTHDKGTPQKSVRRSLGSIVNLYEKWDKLDKAKKWKKTQAELAQDNGRR